MKLSKGQKLAGLVVVASAVLGLGAAAWAQTSADRPTLGAVAVAAQPADPATTATTSPTSTAPPSTGTAAPSTGKPTTSSLPVRPGPLVRRTVHGDLIVRGKGGAFVSVTYDRGKVTAASTTSISLQRPDGVRVTITINGDTTFRGIHDASALKVGQPAEVLSYSGTAHTVAQRAG
jgi:hypothetical protein